MGSIPGLIPALQPQKTTTTAQKAANVINTAGGNASTISNGQVLGSYTLPSQPASNNNTAVLGSRTSSQSASQPAQQQQASSSPSQNISTAQLPNLDELYAPIFAQYDNTASQLQTMQGQHTQDLTNAYNQNVGLLPGYEAAGRSTIQANQTNLNNQLSSAYDKAARNFQWANAGNLNAYGYNGAYLGANAMAQQELAREMGQVGQQGVQGTQQINSQNMDLINWVNTQHAKLDQDFAAAKDNLAQFFQEKLMALMSDRTATEQQKAAGKIALLQDVMNQNNAIAMQAQQFKQQVQLAAAQMAATGGQNYDVSGFLSKMGTLGQQINANVNPANQSFAVATGQDAANAPTWITPSVQNNNDYLNKLLGVGQKAS